MLKGEAYLQSAQKRYVDRLFAASLMLPEKALRALAQQSFIPINTPVLFCQERVGQSGELFKIRKIMTLDEEGMPLSELAATYRRNGLDELPQIHHIQSAEMSAVGWRPLTPQDLHAQYDAVGHDKEGSRTVDEHRRLVLTSRPGCVSEYVIEAHRGDILTEGVEAATYRMEHEIAYCQDATLGKDIGMIKFALTSVLDQKRLRMATTISYKHDN